MILYLFAIEKLLLLLHCYQGLGFWTFFFFTHQFMQLHITLISGLDQYELDIVYQSVYSWKYWAGHCQMPQSFFLNKKNCWYVSMTSAELSLSKAVPLTEMFSVIMIPCCGQLFLRKNRLSSLVYINSFNIILQIPESSSGFRINRNASASYLDQLWQWILSWVVRNNTELNFWAQVVVRRFDQSFWYGDCLERLNDISGVLTAVYSYQQNQFSTRNLFRWTTYKRGWHKLSYWVSVSLELQEYDHEG